MTKVVVLGAKSYRFADRESGDIKEGVSVHYIDPRTMNLNGVKGLEPLKANLSPDSIESFNQGNGVYDIEYAHVPKKGKMELVPVSFKFFKKIDLNSLIS